MKNFKLGLVCFCMSALLLSACSKEENTTPELTQSDELIDLSLNISLLDFERSSAESKQSIDDFPDCILATPYYIEICIMQGDREVVGKLDDPFRIDLAADQMFTRYTPEMALPAGSYTLDHCAVYSEDGTLLCLAPKFGSPMAAMSDTPMPMSINLRAGSKPFPDVPVLCFDNREVNEYGYVFFDIEPTVIRNFCFFANYCSDSGRHYPAKYSLEISVDGNIIYDDMINNTGVEGNSQYYADPLCVDLPIILDYDEDEEYIDYTLTLLPWDEVYDMEEEMTISGSLSRNDLKEYLAGDNIEYEHIFFNCGDENEEIELPDFDNAQFSNPQDITNPYYGPKLPYFYLYYGYELEDGEMPDEPSEIIYVEKAYQNKQILGIDTYIQNDRATVDNITIEDTNDWLAQDDEGNLWYLGEDSKNYDDEGNFLNNEGSWEAGVDGAKPGYWLPANPYVGQRYYQEFYEGEAEDWAEVIAIDATLDIEFGSFSQVLITKDVNPFEPDEYELKYYAPDWGLVKEEKYEDGELVEIVVLEVLGVID